MEIKKRETYEIIDPEDVGVLRVLLKLAGDAIFVEEITCVKSSYHHKRGCAGSYGMWRRSHTRHHLQVMASLGRSQ